MVTLALLALVVAGGWVLLRRSVRGALGLAEPGAAPGAALAALALGLAGALVLWAGNPYAGGFAALALHLWLLAAAPETRPRRGFGVALAVIGALPMALVLAGYAAGFGVGPARLAWMLALAVAGGALPLGTAVAWSLMAGSFGAVLALAARHAPGPAPAPRVAGRPSVLGPAGYSGPGSLGGTESALRR